MRGPSVKMSLVLSTSVGTMSDNGLVLFWQRFFTLYEKLQRSGMVTISLRCWKGEPPLNSRLLVSKLPRYIGLDMYALLLVFQAIGPIYDFKMMVDNAGCTK